MDQVRVYSRPLLGAIIAPNPGPRFFKKIFSLEMVKNGIFSGGANNHNALFGKKCAPKNAHTPVMSKIEPASKVCGRQHLKNLKRYDLLKADHTPSIFLKAVFHKFYLVYS